MTHPSNSKFLAFFFYPSSVTYALNPPRNFNHECSKFTCHLNLYIQLQLYLHYLLIFFYVLYFFTRRFQTNIRSCFNSNMRPSKSVKKPGIINNIPAIFLYIHSFGSKAKFFYFAQIDITS